jgi:hypothetical protein
MRSKRQSKLLVIGTRWPSGSDSLSHAPLAQKKENMRAPRGVLRLMDWQTGVW